MSHTSDRRWSTRAAQCAAVLLTTGLLALFCASSAAAAGISAVAAASANPPAFVPDWDGHTDATVIEYTLADRSKVHVRIIDAGGRVVATIDSGVRTAGTHLVAWDGRDARGNVQPAGSYWVRVDARPLPRPAGAAVPGSANAGGVIVAGARGAVITLQRPPVAIRGIRMTRPNLGRSGRAALTAARFDLSTDASVSAAVIAADGRVVRTLVTSRMGAGGNTVTWNGRDGTGRPVVDGAYQLVIAAGGTGRPTASSRLPLQVDRTLPRVSAVKRTKSLVGSDKILVPIVVRVSEPSVLTVMVGRRATRRTLAAGLHRLTIPGTQLGIDAAPRARSVPVRLVIVDASGNAVARSMATWVPARRVVNRRPAPPQPPPAQPVVSMPAAGKLPWPVGGIVTSEFGMRAGRPHTGLDIAVPNGTPIHSIGPGKIAFIGVYGGYGNLVMVDHPTGMRTYYAHMSRFGGFAVGDPVQHTDVIGYVGCTGSCSGPHVHFETRVGDPSVPRDPRAYLQPR